MSDSAPRMIFFAGRFEHATDGQLRTQVPSKWRSKNTEERYYVQLLEHDSAGKRLKFLPEVEAARVAGVLNRKGETDAGEDDYMRAVASQMETVDLDSAGRITLPETMASAAGIGANEKVVLSGGMTFFEVWSLDRHSKVRVADEALLAKRKSRSKK